MGPDSKGNTFCRPYTNHSGITTNGLEAPSVDNQSNMGGRLDRGQAYRWRGRSEKYVLTSSMDDYPRAPPHIGELHRGQKPTCAVVDQKSTS